MSEQVAKTPPKHKFAIPYRPEVDGLRAVAVIPVILFHAKVAGFAGGFVGVDVFFVISGYLITSIILKEAMSGEFSIIRFYERRARRILPALTLVLALSAVVGFVVMPPVNLQVFGQALVAAMLFASNVFSYLTTNYFASAADEKPLLHLWSLGVEEQFYVVFPLLIVMLVRFGQRAIGICIAVLAACSFGLAELLLAKQALAANYFLTFSRGWELLAGSGLAMLPRKRLVERVWLCQVGSLIGLLMIAWSTFVLNEDTPFPGFYAVPSVLGAAFIIAFSTQDTWVGRLLRTRAFVLIGLISYPLYLWHQPVFAFTRIVSTREPSTATLMVGALVSTVLAYVTWKYVESYFRDKSRVSRAQVFRYSLVSISTFLVLGVIAHFEKGFPGRFAPDDLYADPEGSPKTDQCYTYGTSYLAPQQSCRYFEGAVTWAVLGDSHAQEPAYALAEKLEARNQGVLQLSFMGCAPILSKEYSEPGCTAWLRESVAFIESDPSIENVLLAFRHTLYVHGENIDTYPDVTPLNVLPGDLDLSPAPSLEEMQDFYRTEFTGIVDRLREAGKKVYVLYPIPELPMDIRKGRWPVTIFDRQGRLNLDHATSSDYYRRRQAFATDLLDGLSASGKVVPLRTSEFFCGETSCVAQKDHELLYRDDDHLSLAGVRQLFRHYEL